MDEALKEKDHNGFLSFNPCNLHVFHNAFRYGINSYVEEAEKQAYHLYTFFNLAPCKKEDFRNIASLFYRHINSLWMTLVPGKCSKKMGCF